MIDVNDIRENLHSQGLPVYETDLPFIQSIFSTMEQAQTSLQSFPYLNITVPITVVDKDLMT